MANSFRIYGPNLSESEAYVDVTVDGLTREGQIELSDDSEREWTVETVHLEKWIRENTAHDTEVIDTTNPVWSAVDTVEFDTSRSEVSLSWFAARTDETEYNNCSDNEKFHFIEAVCALFKGV